MYRQEINITTLGKNYKMSKSSDVSMRKMTVNLIEKEAKARKKQFTKTRLQMVLTNVKLCSTQDKRNVIFN